MTYRLHYAPDNASLIVRLTLEEMGLAYETVLVDRSISAQRSEGYLDLNPNGLIPVLETEHGPKFETGAILLWLSERHGEMMPTGPDRADALKWLFFVSNTLHADMRILFYPAKYTSGDAAPVRRSAIKRLKTHLGILENMAASGQTCFGAVDPTVLDYYIAACLRWLAIYPADTNRDWFQLTAYPTLEAALSRLETRPAIRAAQAAEGLGPTPFTAPVYAAPPEGSAT
ncbi:glutathione S-transferase family protein [Thalassococcus sp. S3]|uniref:glutathione S-transferase family protein n=1 Tax=Thalassococcus sp. S3 TaxID=2017482 RepID=UPI0010241B28|nr:glutathione S-transferase family protein [Thalassococcus sp. S3]QBF32745.1 glutathione S-transferase [Thalassococcus sp. S3]